MELDLTLGELVAEGKTKEIHALTREFGMVLFRAKPDITAHDDPNLTRQIETKPISATTTTCRVFELLARAGIPVAFDRQDSSTSFVGHRCKMIPLEVVARRYAVGSFTQRHPECARPEGAVPYRFHAITCELFLKTTEGRMVSFDGEHIADMPKDPAKPIAHRPVDDPLIRMDGDTWSLHHPKLPPHDPCADLGMSVNQTDILPHGVAVSMLVHLLQRVFLVLEGAWAQLGMRFIDLKIEFGIDCDGQLRVADVIDNDSWRLRTADWQDVSKQSFRDGQALAVVEEKYQFVAALVEQFRLPQQAVVVWCGSDKDDVEADLLQFGTSFVEGSRINCSAHKSPQRALRRLEDLLTEYPDGGVIIANAGKSNGLGPILAARTSWPVIAVCATADKHPEDLWSSLRMPSNVPLLVAPDLKNARLAALNVLAQKNPVAYMLRQLEIEQFDD